MPSKLEMLLQLVKAKKGAYGAQRVERAADEIKNLEKLYSQEALSGAFLGDNAKALMSMPTKNFERYAVPLKQSSDLKLEFVEGLPEMTRDEYIKYLSKVKGLADVPYLEIGRQASGKTPYIAGHEGRHRMRALNQAGQESGLVVLQPRYELREPLPRRSQEEYINALRQEIGAKPVVSPELAKSASPEVRPDIELPEIYKQGGKVSQDAMHMAVMNQKVQKKAAGGGLKKDGDLVDELISEAKKKQEAPVNPFRMPTQKQSQYEKDFRQYLANQQAAREQVITELPQRLIRGAIPGAAGAAAGYAAQVPGAAGDIASLYQEVKPENWPNLPDVVQSLPTTERIQQYFFPEDKTSPEFQAGITGGNIAALGQGIASLPAAAKGVAKGATAGSKALANEAAYRIHQAMTKGEGPLAGALAGVAPRPLITWHGSPHRFPPTEKNPLGEFDPTKIGTGEGAQAYGYGHYLAEAPGTAHEYRARLAGRPEIVRLKVGNKAVGPYNQFDYSPKTSSTKENIHASLIEDLLIDESDLVAAHSSGGDKAIQKIIMDNLDRRIKDYADEWPEGIPYAKQLKDELSKRGSVSLKMGEKPGSFYAVNLPDEAIAKMLDWDKPLSEQPERVKSLFSTAEGDPRRPLGQHLYKEMVKDAIMGRMGGNFSTEYEAANFISNELRKAGIPGIKYLDQASRGTGEGTRNFVVFPGNESLMNIVGREKKGGVIHKAEGGLTSDDLIVEETPL